MRRFLALSWDCFSSLALTEVRRYTDVLQATAPGWNTVEAVGLRVFHDWPTEGPWRHWTLPNQRGVVFGQLFERGALGSDAAGSAIIDPAAAQRMAASGGRFLMERYWGTFIAFLADPLHRTRLALRSVSAGMACYRLQRRHVDVFFSDFADLTLLGVENLDIDWRYLAGFLQNSQLALADSALKDVSELLAGECVQMGPSSTQREMLWNPGAFCQDAGASDPVHYADELRSTTQQCIEAWAGAQGDVLLQLSGGLDSAIVLGCLRRTRRHGRIVCFNRYAAGAEEDERAFAHAAARSAGAPLEERPWESLDIQLERRLQECPMAPKPAIPALLQIDVRVQQELMATLRAHACWSGEGGDHLFFEFKTPLIVADYLWRQRRVAGVGAVLRDAARLTRQTFWALAALALRAEVTRNAARLVGPLPHDTSFVSPEALHRERAVQADHPWMGSLQRAPPGKLLQIRHLIELLHRHAPIARASQSLETHPLISLPLIELCLAIPTWLAVRGGRNRALAREAFADRVPAVIRERESKGSTGRFLTTAMRQRAPILRELLMEGILAREGLVNRRAIECHLVRGQPLRPGQLFSLCACVAAEVWLRARNARHRSY